MAESTGGNEAVTGEVGQLVQERGRVHGDFTDVARVGQELKDIARRSANWSKFYDFQKEGLDMILHKVARILCGDPNHYDHWDDIAGYAKITSIRIPSAAPAPEKK